MEPKNLGLDNYVEEIVNLIRSHLNDKELFERLSDYHENDIAEAVTELTAEERRKLYQVLGVQRVA